VIFPRDAKPSPQGCGRGLTSSRAWVTGDPGADRLQGQRTRTKLANALANCAIVSVQRAEQLVSLAKGNSPINTYHSFSTEQIHRKFNTRLPHVYPQPAHGRRKESSWDTHRIVQKPQRIVQKAIRSRFHWDFSPEFSAQAWGDVRVGAAARV
jgi:hypothetical protein